MTIKRKLPGLTLVEFSIALAIFATTILVGVLLFSSILRLNSRSQAVRETQQTGRYLMERMGRDIRLTNSVLIGNGGRSIELTNPHRTDGTVSYRLSGESVETQTCSDESGVLVCSGWLDLIDNPRLRVIRLEFTRLEGDNRGAVRISTELEHGADTITEENPDYYQYGLDSVVTMRR